MSVLKRLFLFLPFLLAATAHAGEGADRLQAFLDQVDGLRANFEQVVVGGAATEVRQSGGKLFLLRPDRFRWDYERPYEQVIISDGRKLWIYDKDLEQVTVKPLDTALNTTPAMVLSSREPLTRNFQVREMGEHRGRTWVELKPLDAESEFRSIRLAMGVRDLEIMELEDNFGQVTRLQFSYMERNPAFPEGLFQFEPPEGVDVIRAPE
jgi:outer membrane lipoprotein carrier protein